MLGAVTIAGLLIAANWVIYVAAVVSHHVTEASLGYFLNPLVTVAIGVVVLRERLRRLQWAAVAVGRGRRHLPHRHLGPAAVDRPRAGRAPSRSTG